MRGNSPVGLDFILHARAFETICLYEWEVQQALLLLLFRPDFGINLFGIYFWYDLDPHHLFTELFLK